MATSRRDFLKKGSLVALVAGLPMGFAEKAFGKEAVAPSGALGLTKGAFESQLNTTFLINEKGSKVAVRLAAVTDLRRGEATRRGGESFSLLFRGDDSTALTQNTYLIEHKKLGLFSFLVVPVMTKNKRAPYYEAIVNHLHR